MRLNYCLSHIMIILKNEFYSKKFGGYYYEGRKFIPVGPTYAPLETPGHWELQYALQDRTEHSLSRLGEPEYLRLNREELVTRAANLRRLGVNPTVSEDGIGVIDRILNKIALKHPGRVIGTVLIAEDIRELHPTLEEAPLSIFDRD